LQSSAHLKKLSSRRRKLAVEWGTRPLVLFTAGNGQHCGRRGEYGRESGQEHRRDCVGRGSVNVVFPWSDVRQGGLDGASICGVGFCRGVWPWNCFRTSRLTNPPNKSAVSYLTPHTSQLTTHDSQFTTHNSQLQYADSLRSLILPPFFCLTKSSV